MSAARPMSGVKRASRAKTVPGYERELELMRAGHGPVAGVDEAGRGPLAGPVVAGAVVLTSQSWGELGELGEVLRDSKALTAPEREAANALIRAGAAWGLGVVEPEEIDALNIRVASWEAMRRAVLALSAAFPASAPGFVLADGLACREHPWPWPHEALIKGDARCASIAAASIVAKVARDAIMVELDARYPGYGFARHKGYPTRAHYEALARLGPCPEHRRSFGPVRAVLGA